MGEALLCNLFTLTVAKCDEFEIALSIWPRERQARVPWRKAFQNVLDGLRTCVGLSYDCN